MNGSRSRGRFGIVLGCAWCVLGCGGAPNPATSVPTAKSPPPARAEVQQGPVRVTVELAASQVRLSDEPELTLTVESEPGVEVRFPGPMDATGDFAVREVRELLPRTDGRRQIVQRVYRLEPTQAGVSQIDPLVITFLDQREGSALAEQSVQTDPLTVEVVTTLDPTAPSLAALKEPADPVPLPAPPRYGWWAAGGVLLACLAAMAVWRLRTPAASAPPPAPRDQAERELQSLWASGLARSDVKRFYIELTGIIRRYVERTTGIHAPEQTTEEFLQESSRGMSFSDGERQRLREFLEAADLVKFAAHEPDFKAVEESYRRARTFVGLTTHREPRP